MMIEDPGKEDGKNYIIKVEVDKKDEIITINDKQFFAPGAR
jgi:hypothetical protein